MFGTKYKNAIPDVAINAPEGRALSDDELEAERIRTQQQARDEQAKSITDSYGVGSAIGDALLRRAGFGTPIKNYKEMQYASMQDSWAREDKATEELGKKRKEIFTKRLHDGIVAVADPNSPFYGDLAYMQATANDPVVKRNLGIQGTWSAIPTGMKDPNTGLPIYDISDIDEKTGKVYSKTQGTAQQVIDYTLGQMNPQFQQEMAEGIAKSAVALNNRIRIFNHFKDQDPELAEFAAGIGEDPFKAKLGMFNKFMDLITTDKRFKGWTPNDAVAAIFGKRMSDDRYEFKGTELVEDPETHDAGLKVFDKITKKLRVIPIDGYSWKKYQQDQIDLYGAKKEASETTKDKYPINNKLYNDKEYKVIENIQKTLQSQLKNLNENDYLLVSPVNEDIKIDEAARYYELIKDKRIHQLIVDAELDKPGAKSALKLIYQKQDLPTLIPLVGKQSE